MKKLYQVSGCSMEPALRNGQIVEVVESYKDGDVVVAEHEGRFIIKRLVGDRLLGDNRVLSTDFFVADVRILGRAEVRTKEELEERGVQIDSLSLQKVYAAVFTLPSSMVNCEDTNQFTWRAKKNYPNSQPASATISVDTTRKYSGTGCIRLTANEVLDFLLIETLKIPIEPGKTYKLSGYITTSLGNVADKVTHIRIYYYGKDGTEIETHVGGAVYGHNAYEWVLHTITTTAPSNAVYLTIGASLFTGSNSGNPGVDFPIGTSLYLDALTLEGDGINNNPALTLSTQNNLNLTEGSILPITGSASDADNGDVLTVKYKINSGTIRNITSGVVNGTPLSFAKSLTFSNKRLRDGTTEVTVDLAENVDHTLTVWAEDDKGGKSAEVTRKFRVIHNRPPVISGTNEDLGTIQAIPSKTYTVTEPEGDAFTVTEKINGKVIRSFAGVAEQENTITIPHDLWIRLQPGVQHTLAIEATDSKGMTAARTYTFVRQENKLEFKLKKPFVTDIAAKRILVTIDAVVPNGAMMKIEACNNAFDASPTWEDITNHVRFNRGFLFTNTEKTADRWGVDIRFVFEKGTATSQVIVNGFGGAFD
ncbi:S26 family signal peptidase [Aneurinibacillus aneurinilyticus]|uniref:S26 family signal peptidase n=1 Tax=Aneurinibacillus aneurinilyticus TaxID=1391 RepID=UPI0035268FD8